MLCRPATARRRAQGMAVAAAGRDSLADPMSIIRAVI